MCSDAKIKLLLLFLLATFLIACSKDNSAKIQELLDNGNQAKEHFEYDLATDYYEQVLDLDSENLTARYALEDIFKQTLIEKKYDVSQNIYAYIYKLNSKGDGLTKLQNIIEEQDKNMLYKYKDCLSYAFFCDDNNGQRNISNIEMELNSFINLYDPNGFRNEFFEYYGKDENEMRTDFVYYDQAGNLKYNCEVHIFLNEFTDNYLDCGLYLKDTKEVGSDSPIHVMDYDSSVISKYSPLESKKFEKERKAIKFDSDICLSDTHKQEYARDNKLYKVVNTDSILPANLIDCVIYCVDDDEYSVVVSSSADGDWASYTVETIPAKDVNIYLNQYTETLEMWLEDPEFRQAVGAD